MRLTKSRKLKFLAVCVLPLLANTAHAALPSCAHQEITYAVYGKNQAQQKLTTNKDCKFFLTMNHAPAGDYNVYGTFLNTSNVSSVATGTNTPTTTLKGNMLANGRVNLIGMLTCNADKKWVINSDPNNTQLYDCGAPAVSTGSAPANTPAGASSPVATGASGGSCWKLASTHSDHVVAIKKDGSLWTWGLGAWGQLGHGSHGDESNLSTPIQVGTESNWVVADAGDNFTLAVKSDGTLWGWGLNGNRGLGDGTRDNKDTPTQIGADTDWKMVDADRAHVVAVKADGSLWSWGYGSGRNLPSDTAPVRVGTDADFLLATAGMSSGTALSNNGTIMSWGQNRYGALGIGQTGSAGEHGGSSGLDKSEKPLVVGKVTDKWSAVKSSGFTTYAIKSDGSLWVWGVAPFKTAIANSPKQIGSNRDWKFISNADAGIRNNGSLWIWGAVANANNKATPMKQFGADRDWSSISTGRTNYVALKSDGSLWTWGKGAFGQLGNGTNGANANSSSPVGVSCQ